MSVIGKFQSTNGEILGEIFTLTVQLQNVRIVREEGTSNEDAPTHRIFVGRAEIGAAWSKTSRDQKAYLSLKIDDPSFSQPLFANLFQDAPGDYTLVWSRSRS
ncbi:DUF736 domain-containing protein [Asticcacaulis sp.]|uniref:DUF736 domain-containing protein n=1 Tax=Asticcacaulis sp. TaxID=1872648 RepID=UPI002B8B2DEE|nr:DUF736 domain-containing protein [Asticcacaulis sp.]HTM82185.1 DUF736 domain-containing protein [Asticcacaulis sp.]